MDVNFLRSMVTVGFFAAFLGIIAWAYSKKNRQDFDDAAALPFQADDTASATIGGARE
ncbi:cytochrome c oxidase cbb3-type subunit 4 [Sphaerotilus hippei]|uniref:Cytochrome c oxidase cbb3-type subunit 4 n=1 Tax=Sphaerotilus hippei TaxID=744406 RepID=A0A318H4R6_9BURK|nr:cbb3-type cytochrome c oxidase subunit 3 [Sphaerotilus hippei]PXW98731.1 cytochrome c oxidase cbb3-type subunit 4 [Sphaerotilus hippei]